MRAWRLLAPALAVGIAASLAACQSSQDKSAELAKHGATVLKAKPGLQVKGHNASIKVLGSSVVRDQNGAAVVVTLQNNGSQALVDVPIAIDVLDAKGKKVFTNTTPGLSKSLQSVPVLEPGKPVDWVNDQVFVSGAPKSVKVQVGNSTKTQSSADDPAAVTVSKPTISNSSALGPEANGTIKNNTSTEQDRLLLYAVARKGGKVVAAGRGGVKKVRTDKPANYHLFFIGNPNGADVTVTAYPNKLD